LIRTLFTAIFVVFAFSMAAVFHFIWSEDYYWALVWWCITIIVIPSGTWISWRLVRARYLSYEVSFADMTAPLSVMVAFTYVLLIGANFFYGY
jgi:hypothetical protein